MNFDQMNYNYNSRIDYSHKHFLVLTYGRTQQLVYGYECVSPSTETISDTSITGPQIWTGHVEFVIILPIKHLKFQFYHRKPSSFFVSTINISGTRFLNILVLSVLFHFWPPHTKDSVANKGFFPCPCSYVNCSLCTML